MKALLTSVFVATTLISTPSVHGASDPGGLAQRITAAKPATADGSRAVISMIHAALLQPPSQVTSEARGVCARFLPTAIAGMRRGHVATCALQADAFEALATCAWLAGDRKKATEALQKKLSHLDCPAEGVNGVRRATRLAAAWMWPEAMEATVFKQRESLKGRGDASPRSLRAVELNIQALAESRRQRAAIRIALGSRKPGGLLVLASASGSAAAKAGLRRDDIVILAGATPVRGLRQLRTLTKQAATTPLTVLRRGSQVQLVLRGVLEGVEVIEVPPLR